MEFSYDKLIIEPLVLRKESEGGIFLPEFLHHPDRVGRVIDCGKKARAMGINPGDMVTYYMKSPSDIDGRNKMVVYLDKKMHIVTFPNMISGIIINQEDRIEMIKKAGIDALKLDYTKDVKPVGSKVFVALQEKETMTSTGIKLPDYRAGLDEIYGEVVAVGPNANRQNYDPEEIKVGDFVALGRTTSGGVMGKDHLEREILKCNGEEIKMKLSGDDWVPVGPRAIIEPYYNGMVLVEEEQPHPFRKGTTHKVKVWKREDNPNIVVPYTNEIMNLTSRVISVGSGCNETHSMAKVYSVGGPPVFKPGDMVLHSRLYSTSGREKQPASGVYPMIGESDRFLVMMYHLDAKLNIDDKIEMKPTTLDDKKIGLADFD